MAGTSPAMTERAATPRFEPKRPADFVYDFVATRARLDLPAADRLRCRAGVEGEERVAQLRFENAHVYSK